MKIRIGTLLAVLCVWAVISASNGAQVRGVANTTVTFQQFVQQFNKTYSSVEEREARHAIFNENMLKIAMLNAASATQPFGVTKFSDMSESEFAFKFLRAKASGRSGSGIVPDMSVPDKVDWRNTVGKYISPPRNQGSCGCCWAISAAENVETVFAMSGNPLTKASVQQLIDCDQNDDGCDGGNPSSAFSYISDTAGLEPASEYPFQARLGTCKAVKGKETITMNGWLFITDGGSSKKAIQQMKTAVVKNSISVCVQAQDWQHYSGGVFDATCGQLINHCVSLDGYNVATSDGDSYWIVRNSWGTDWGINGYIYIKMGSNLCGIQNEVTTVTQ